MDVDNDNADQLRIQRVAGGSVIKRQPVFSADGDILFIIWDNVVRAYSSQTGEWIRDLDGANAEIINVQPDATNTKILYACTEDGQIISWKVKSGVVDKRSQLKPLDTASLSVLAFHSVDLGDSRASALVAFRAPAGAAIQLALFDLTLGHQLADQPLHPFDLSPTAAIQIDVANAHNYFALIQDANLHVHTLRGTAVHRRWRNAQKKLLTSVRVHQHEELVATGDELGRIFVWRSLFEGAASAGGQPLTRLYHWHHTAVRALCFSETGSQLYSGGGEAVLVRWTLSQQSEQKSFLPRLAGSAVHLAVGAQNQKIALATADNGIQVLNSQFKPLAVVQNFTWVADDRTVTEKFPIGLRVNPRNSSLVLNGRVGHLQFFSTHTRSLLYNLDTTAQNRLSLETAKVLYNTCITHTAVAMDWLVTGELLDDQQTAVELRMKFWHFDAGKQTYVLNTQVELPHEHGLRALEFSSAFDGDEGLVCASAGVDNVVKVWTLERSDDPAKKGRFWACTGRTQYKHLPVESLAFSADASLLAVGYANTLCVYQADGLRLKAVLSCPAGLDGGVNKVTLNIPTEVAAATPAEKTPKREAKRAQVLEKRRKMVAAVRAYLANDAATAEGGSDLVRTVSAKLGKLAASRRVQTASAQLTLREQELVHKRIMAQLELNFYQKLELFGQLRLRSTACPEVAGPFAEYLQQQNTGAERLRSRLPARVAALPESQRYKVQRSWFNYARRLGAGRRLSGAQSVRDLVSFEELTAGEREQFTVKKGGKQTKKTVAKAKAKESAATAAQLPVKSVAQIKHVAFGSGEFAHLVIVCTERRLLIWNLLTLRLQTAIKLSVHRLTVDPYTSLVAAFTVYNELYVFLPNVPYTLYQRKNMPSIHGAAWIPRRYPKSHTLNLDWQATSQLYFLSTKQEILQLVSDSDVESLASSAAYLQQDGQAPLTYTPFGAMIAKQIHNATNKAAAERLPPGSLATGRNGRSTVKEIINMQTHTMDHVHLLCSSLLRSLTISTDATANERLHGGSAASNGRTSSSSNGISNGRANGNGNAAGADDDDDDDDDDDNNEANEARRRRMSQSDALARQQKEAAEDAHKDQLAVEKRLQKLAKRSIVLEF